MLFPLKATLAASRLSAPTPPHPHTHHGRQKIVPKTPTSSSPKRVPIVLTGQRGFKVEDYPGLSGLFNGMTTGLIIGTARQEHTIQEREIIIKEAALLALNTEEGATSRTSRQGNRFSSGASRRYKDLYLTP